MRAIRSQTALHLRAPRLAEPPPQVERAGDRRRELRIDRVERAHLFGGERVAGGVGSVEARKVAQRECADQRAHAVRIARVEARVREERAHDAKRVVARTLRLQLEPFVEHQRLVAPSGLEPREECIAHRRLRIAQRGERTDRIGHVVAGVELLRHERMRGIVVERAQITQA